MPRPLPERLVLALSIATAVLAAPAVADPPDILRNYRFIPSHSVVHVTGGFAGIDWDLNVAGHFGLVTGYNYGADPAAHVPTLEPFAQFTDVNAILFDPRRASPLPSPGWDLDKTLNLSGLDGTFRDPSRLFFRGVDGQGQPFKLEAILADRLIHLVGANDPGCCDFFNYQIDAYAHLAPFADFNFDGVVDAADYTAWRDHMGMASGATLDQGDADGDGDVDQDDYAVLRQDFGTSIDMAALADAEGLSLGAVPEPATVSLLLIGSAGDGPVPPPAHSSRQLTPKTNGSAA